MNDPSLKMLIIGISCILMWNASMTAYNELLNLSQTFSGITLQSKQTNHGKWRIGGSTTF